ncbi:putative transcription termination factor [Metamycoplasma cloacale]|uniref:YlxR family protein n=1 Tax=Metamycoplasma cloacale TaxID=92401 RepID=A0A2Z4LM74_9BACT|nr:YlxR family protein [Metamycoplasma cloacale]AWX42901.1 YlxR family protein [Metamycoplasma cloacale]VEU79275.1 putative transcription termination factor [Metamycoplasma cloacale]
MKTDRNYSRKSIVDNQIYPIDQLIRFNKNKFNVISFDEFKNLEGRGAYCLINEEQIKVLFKKRLLNKAFRQNIDQEIYNNIQKEVEEWLVKTGKKESQTLM